MFENEKASPGRFYCRPQWREAALEGCWETAGRRNNMVTHGWMHYGTTLEPVAEGEGCISFISWEAVAVKCRFLITS